MELSGQLPFPVPLRLLKESNQLQETKQPLGKAFYTEVSEHNCTMNNTFLLIKEKQAKNSGKRQSHTFL
jgi:hypothetical protein